MEQISMYLLPLLAFVAFLYASVGHGGASGYLAVMALLGVSAAVMKPSALAMNLAVSLSSFIGFAGSGHFKWKLFWPLALGSIPMAFIGGTITLSDDIYKKVLAIFIFISILRMLYQNNDNKNTIREASIGLSLLIGGLIGLASGMIGIGGGIILSPLLLLLGWANMRQTAAISALFIFVNSVSGLLGQVAKGTFILPQNMLYALVVTVLGGILGSYFGSKKFNIPTLKYLLALGLSIACIKLIFT